MTYPNQYQIVQLDPKAITFRRSESGMLAVHINGIDYEEVTVMRLYPLSHPDQYILVSVVNGDEIGIIDNIRGLSTEAQVHVNHELRLRYLVPLVTQIRKITSEPGMWRWDIRTDRGEMRMLLPNLHDHVIAISEDRLLISDHDGKRCEIRISALDHYSRMQLKKVE